MVSHMYLTAMQHCGVDQTIIIAGVIRGHDKAELKLDR